MTQCRSFIVCVLGVFTLAQRHAIPFDTFCVGAVGSPSGFSCTPGENIHKQITLDALRGIAMPNCALSRIADGAGAVDMNEYTFLQPNGSYDPSHHFDRPPNVPHQQAFIASTAYVRLTISQARAELTAGNAYSGLRLIGMALHAVQDFFSHSNFVELDPRFLQLSAGDRALAVNALLGLSNTVPPNLRLAYYDPGTRHAHDYLDGEGYTHEDHAKDNGSRLGYSVARALAVQHSADVIRAAISGFNAVLCSEPDGRTVTVVGAYDPNDKIGKQGESQQRYVSRRDLRLPYSISFENKQTATAPAQDVVITDALDLTRLNIGTVTLGPIGVRNKLVTPPSIPLVALGTYTTTVDLRPTDNLLVKISTVLNAATGVLTWTFNSLDPTTGQPPEDPLAGFLPPSVGVASYLLPHLTSNPAYAVLAFP